MPALTAVERRDGLGCAQDGARTQKPPRCNVPVARAAGAGLCLGGCSDPTGGCACAQGHVRVEAAAEHRARHDQIPYYMVMYD